MTPSDALLACPFPLCGMMPRSGECRDSDDGYSFIECPSKEHICMVHADSMEDAQRIWNTRATPPAGDVEAVAEAIFDEAKKQSHGKLPAWESVNDATRENWRRYAKAALAQPARVEACPKCEGTLWICGACNYSRDTE